MVGLGKGPILGCKPGFGAIFSALWLIFWRYCNKWFQQSSFDAQTQPKLSALKCETSFHFVVRFFKGVAWKKMTFNPFFLLEQFFTFKFLLDFASIFDDILTQNIIASYGGPTPSRGGLVVECSLPSSSWRYAVPRWIRIPSKYSVSIVQ